MMYVHYILTSHVWHQLVPHNTTHNPDSPLPHPTPFFHPSAMTSTPSVLSNKLSIDSIGPNKELPNFADIAWDVQNQASCRVGLESTKARLFHEFFGMCVKVVKILISSYQGGAAWSTCSGCYI